MAIKKEYSDCLLFFRLGDFYELFLDDAHTGAQVLGITLTSRPKGKDGRIPMAGVPYHAVDNYLSKLVKAGYKVAICEQITEPNSKGIVEREVVRVVTPGTLLDERALIQKEHNYLCSVFIDGVTIALSWCDLSTGALFTKEIVTENIEQTLINELSQVSPSECILPAKLYNSHEFLGFIRQRKEISVFPFHKWISTPGKARRFLLDHFKVQSLQAFGIGDKEISQVTTASLILYMKETQKTSLSHIQKIIVKKDDNIVKLDRATIINLEIFSTIRDRDTRGSLVSALDMTVTAMGGRKLKSWIIEPLTKKEEIVKRLDAVTELIGSMHIRKKIKAILLAISDIERIFSRITIGVGNARDIENLGANLSRVIEVKHILASLNANLITELQQNISPKIGELAKLISKTIKENPPVTIKDGGMIRENVDPELDKLREIVSGSKDWLTQLEIDERARTGIQTLKVRFNKVFGYYIEISKASAHLAPKGYMRKQTLVNGERYITPELKEREEIILKSQEIINKIEYEVYIGLLKKIATYTDEVLKACNSISEIDCLISFADVSQKWRYVKPTIVYSGEIRIKGGRHPVVEQLLPDKEFVPNDVTFSPTQGEILLITGPNMAGKSVFLRQAALITLMAHIGSYVPADSAHISIVDSIFVRSGASDVISSGLSTFMVEMVETAFILHHATDKSLILMDEIGRGTSTYDGVSIAWAVAEHIATQYKTPPKTIFATHYHELTALEKVFPKRIKNYHMAVEEVHGKPIFLHTLKKGPASKSFGVAVAQLAGVPSNVINRANEMLHSIEAEEGLKLLASGVTPDRYSIEVPQKVVDALSEIDIDKTTPLDALKFLSNLKDNIKIEDG